MNTIRKRAIGDEKGKVLILVLVLLVVGGLVLTPLLGLASTGLTAGQVYERKTAQLYAADAGVEDAIWKIQHHNDVDIPDWPETCGDAPWDEPYNYPKDGDPPFVVNDNDVQVFIMYLSGGIYRITSTASDDENSTTVESYVKATLKPKDGGEPEDWYDWEDYEGGNIEKGAKVYVDGNLTLTHNIETGAFVYVTGDLVTSATFENFPTTVYVEGNLNMTDGAGISEDGVKVCVGGDARVAKVETGAKLYVEGNLTVYQEEGDNRTGKIEGVVDPREGENTVVCVGGELFVETAIENDPAIYATTVYVGANPYAGFSSFDQCTICCWGCLGFELVVDVLTYEVGAVV